jgi:diguanylate cyclase (GGDEF)-like protein
MSGFHTLPGRAKLLWGLAIGLAAVLLPTSVLVEQQHLPFPLLLGLGVGAWLLDRITRFARPSFTFHYANACVPAVLVLAGPQAALAVHLGTLASRVQPSWAQRRDKWFKWAFSLSQGVLAIAAAWTVTRPLGDSPLVVLMVSTTWEVTSSILSPVMASLASNRSPRAMIAEQWKEHGWSFVQEVLLAVCLIAVWRAQPLLGPAVLFLVFVQGRVARKLTDAAEAAATARREAILEGERARCDGLTGLFNRRALDERLESLASEDGGVVLLDLDHFKRINDTYGHATGDLVLQAAAEATRAAVRPGDFCARYGGEELCVLLPGIETEGQLAQVAERIRRDVEQVRVAQVPDLVITASIGASLLAQRSDVHAALGRADQAMFRAKSMGRNQVQLADGVDRSGSLAPGGVLRPAA